MPLMDFLNKNRIQYFWSKILIIISTLSFVFYMYYSQYLIEESYNWKWLVDSNSTNVPTKVNGDFMESAPENVENNKYMISSEDKNKVNIIDSEKELTELKNNEPDPVFPVTTTATEVMLEHIDQSTTTVVKDKENLKVRTILQWSPGKNSPFYHMGRGNTNFMKLSCPYVNCFVTDNKRYFNNLTEFDAVIFNGNAVIHKDKKDLPQIRSQEQIYVFGATESAHNNPACKSVLDGFFNWTYTYRLDSEVRWSYIVIYDKDGNEVGPKPDMKWPEEMDPIDEETKAILDGKSKTAAWFVSHCKTLSKREDFVKMVEKELKKIDQRMSVDVYGRCGKFTCTRSRTSMCYRLIRRDYYFYFSFENSFATDYVTEKLLTALNNFAVPVVYGGADYSRYLPPGSYLDARELGPEKLATTMKEIIDNRTLYYDFFRWRNHFKYKQGENDTEICNLCTALNDQKKVKATTLYENFRDWWYPDWKNHNNCK